MKNRIKKTSVRFTPTNLTDKAIHIKLSINYSICMADKSTVTKPYK